MQPWPEKYNKDMPVDYRNIREGSKRAQLRFILNELTAGLTFANIARHGGDGGARARKGARVAYDSVLRFRSRVTLTQGEAGEVRKGMKKLKKQLEELEESS